MAGITSRLIVHPGTALVPEMDREARDRFKEDIRQNGQLVPILTWRGQVIDGRERLRVLRELRMEPIIEKADPDSDPIDVILSANVHRRQLEKGQVAMILAKSNRRSPDDLKAAGVSARTVATAAKVHRIGAPEVVRAVESGKVSLNLANRISELPIDDQPEVVAMADAGEMDAVAERLPSARPKPVHQSAMVERSPSFSGEVVTPKPTPEGIVEQFRKCPHRLETIKQFLAELQPHEREIAAGFFGVVPVVQPAVQEQAADHFVDANKMIEIRDRVTDEMIASPRMIGLASRLGNTATAVGVVRLLLSVTEKHAQRGNIGVMSDAAIAKACDWSGDAAVFVSALVQEGWLQRDLDHRLLVVDWETLCPAAVINELERTGRELAQPTGTPMVKEKNARKVTAVKPVSEFGEAFERFWAAYPTQRKKNKQAAFRRWTLAIKALVMPAGESPDEFIIERATAYAASHEGQSIYASAPDVWLNKGRYHDDESAWADRDAKVEYSPEFERFWVCCPLTRRVEKADAWEAWGRAIKTATGNEGETPEAFLIRRMIDYAKSDQGKGQYAKRPASWLESASFNDADEAWRDFATRTKESSVAVTRPMPSIPGFMPNYAKEKMANAKRE